MLVVCSTVFFMSKPDHCYLQASCTTDMWDLHCSYRWYNVLFNFFALCSALVHHVRLFDFPLLIIILPLLLTHLLPACEVCRSSDQVMCSYTFSLQGGNLISGVDRVSSLVFCFLSILHFE